MSIHHPYRKEVDVEQEPGQSDSHCQSAAALTLCQACTALPVWSRTDGRSTACACTAEDLAFRQRSSDAARHDTIIDSGYAAIKVIVPTTY